MSAQRTSPATGTAHTAKRLVVIGVALLATLAGCTGEPAATTTTEPSPSTTVPAAPPTTSTSVPPPTTTLVPDETTTTESGNAETAVAGAWDEFWVAWAEVRRSENLDRGPLQAVAADSVVDGVIALFERERQTSGPVDTEVATHPNVTIGGEAEAVIEDCVLLRPTFTETVGVWYEADLRSDDDGWRITDLSIRSLQGCVPAVLERAVIEAYEGYFDAEEVFWDPPDPSHPLIEESLADPQLTFIKGLLREHERRGVAFRSDPTIHPEVVEVRSATELVILDCSEPGIDDGLYDLASGERLVDEPPVRAGQRDLRSAVMVFVDGKWKASDFQAQVDYECEFAPTDRGLPSV